MYSKDKEYLKSGIIPGHLFWKAQVVEIGKLRPGLSEDLPEVCVFDFHRIFMILNICLLVCDSH